MNLYHISNEYQLLLEQIYDAETGEILPQVLDKLDDITTKIEDKAIAVAAYIKNLDAEREAIEKAKRSMAEREARLDKRADYLTQYLQTNMERCGITEIKCPEFVIKLKKCPWSTDIIDEDSIPDDYKHVKQVVTVDKVRIKDELLSGVVIPGVQLRQNNRLEIK
jgi:hypothetical protein